MNRNISIFTLFSSINSNITPTPLKAKLLGGASNDYQTFWLIIVS